MQQELPKHLLTDEELALKASSVFTPRIPISTRELFAGRWEHLTTVMDSVNQAGLHVVLFGERGVGKTSLANIIHPFLIVMDKATLRLVIKVNVIANDSFSDVWKRAFDEVVLNEDSKPIGYDQKNIKVQIPLRQKMGIGDQPSIDDVRRTLTKLPKSVFIFDEFDRGSSQLKRTFTDLIKALSDYAVDSTIVIVGVSDTVNNLVKDHASITRAIVQVKLPRMTEPELKEILSKASKALNIAFDEKASSIIMKISQGLPHYTHLIGLHSTRVALHRHSRQIIDSDVLNSFEKAVHEAEQTIQHEYHIATRSAHKDALYKQVIFACAIAASKNSDVLGYFQLSDVLDPLIRIMQRQNITIATFQKHVSEFCEKERGSILQRDGSPRSYKYRFVNPLLLPYAVMLADQQASQMLML